MSVHIFGIRHHGPGSARSLRAALADLQPDAVLIEGPPDADKIIPLVADADMEPPVAILIYAPDDTKQAVYYPFAEYSPEWQAMRYAIANGVQVQFMDLPQTHFFALRQQAPAQQAEPEAEPDAAWEIRRDPLGWLGRAAGYSDGERWWEHMVEQRRDDLEGVFEAILEAMTALREETGPVAEPHEALREAYMRKTIRKAQKDGYQRIAVVCGAWHGPSLVDGSPLSSSARADNGLLKGLPKAKVDATWIPWTHGRLSRESGYGAGIESPGWYHHLWTTEDDVVIRWLSRVAALLREEDLDASTAQVIDAVRLVETLTAIREMPIPGLEEMNEAVQTTMCFGAESPMQLIHERLIVGEMMGEVPPSTPMVPLQRDLRDTVKALKGGRSKHKGSYFGFDAEKTPLNLDLRTETHLKRSLLLHRLRVMGVKWGRLHRSGGKSSFHEDWALQWKPEFEIQLIEASVWGNTVEDAASAFVVDRANNAENLPDLTKLVDAVMLADLPRAAERLIAEIRQKAAVTTDIQHLMDALPRLVEAQRYGDARNTRDFAALTDVIDGMTTRITLGLVNACASLDDDAARAMFDRLVSTHTAIVTYGHHLAQWFKALNKLAESTTVHGMVSGRACRLLLDRGEIEASDAARLLRLAISTAAEPPDAAAWIEGFLHKSGAILLYDDTLFAVLDEWINEIGGDAFTALVPLMRRTFSTFSDPERRQIGERARRDEQQERAAHGMDPERAEAVLPVIAEILGVKS